MKTITSLVPLLGLALPWAAATPITEASAISARADGGWTLIAYQGEDIDGSCTGMSQTITGTVDTTNCGMISLNYASCVDVTITSGFGNCAFKFYGDNTGCSATIPPDNTVTVTGTGSEVVMNVDDVVFYTVDCS